MATYSESWHYYKYWGALDGHWFFVAQVDTHTGVVDQVTGLPKNWVSVGIYGKA